MRTGEVSRAALIFLESETVLRVAQNTLVQIRRAPEQGRSLLDLLNGAVHFFSRSRRDLEIRTPFVNASVEGTEFLVRVATDTLARAVLVSADEICNPAISPDATRIVYGTGPSCSRLMVVSSRGGTPVDITPTARPGTADHGEGALGWTVDGRYVTFSDCRSTPVRVVPAGLASTTPIASPST